MHAEVSCRAAFQMKQACCLHRPRDFIEDCTHSAEMRSSHAVKAAKDAIDMSYSVVGVLCLYNKASLGSRTQAETAAVTLTVREPAVSVGEPC